MKCPQVEGLYNSLLFKKGYLEAFNEYYLQVILDPGYTCMGVDHFKGGNFQSRRIMVSLIFQTERTHAFYIKCEI